MATTPRSLTVAQAADELGVAPARIRSLLSSGALRAAADGSVSAADVDTLARRGTVRSLDVAAVEGALDRALRRRIPDLLGGQLKDALSPLAGEVATALADVEMSTARITAAEAQASTAEARASAAEERAGTAEQALVAARSRVSELEARIAALEAQPVGLFRRRRAVAPA